MTDRIDALKARISELHEQLEQEYAERRALLRYRLVNGRIVWEEEVRRRHAALRSGLLGFLANSPVMHLVTAPVIYALILPFALLDLFVSVYQAICFPVYGIPKVKRGEYIRIDRHTLAYLNGIEKLNCVYCGYCNGLIAYVQEVAGRTEAFWCPIKHAARTKGHHRHYDGFAEFGAAETFRADWDASRRRVRACEGCEGCGSGGDKGAGDGKDG